MIPATVRITFNAKQRGFVESVLREQQFAGGLQQMQQWTSLMDEAVAAVAGTENAGKQFFCSVQCCEFIGLVIENTRYQGNLEQVKQIQALGVSVIETLNKVLAPIRRKVEAEARKADAAAAKAAQE